MAFRKRRTGAAVLGLSVRTVSLCVQLACSVRKIIPECVCRLHEPLKGARGLRYLGMMSPKNGDEEN